MLDCDRRLDAGVAFVTHEFEVFVLEVEDVRDSWVEFHVGQWKRVSRQLFPHLVEMVVVDVATTAIPNELTGFETRDMCDHHRQQRITGDVERHTEEGIGTHYVQIDSLIRSRAITRSCMSPCRADYITVSIRGDPSLFESTWTLPYSSLILSSSAFGSRWAFKLSNSRWRT